MFPIRDHNPSERTPYVTYALIILNIAMFLITMPWAGGAVEFLGTQGDPWDAQADMLMAVTGAMLAQWLLAGVHDRQLARVERAGVEK